MTVTPSTREPEVPTVRGAYCPSATVEDFVLSVANGPLNEFRVLILAGPRGDGKTSGGLAAIVALGQRMVAEGLSHLLPIRVAVVRDTWVNLSRSTISSFKKQAAQGMPIRFLDGGHQAILDPYAHFFFFGVETRADVDRLQGFECGLLWLEEVAPGAEIDVGIPAETFAVGATSVRQEGVPKRIIITMNPSDEDHWVMNIEEVLQGHGLDNIVYHRFNMIAGEKAIHFRYLAKMCARQGRFDDARAWESAADEFDDYRKRNEVFLESIGRSDLVERLVKGKTGGVAMGEAVVSTFDYAAHVTQPGEILTPLPGEEMWRVWDGGLTPSTCWVGITAAGNVNLYGSRTSINKAMAQHIVDEVLPFQSKKYIGEKIIDNPSYPRRPFSLNPPKYTRAGGFGPGAKGGFVYNDIGDPSLFEGDKVQNANLSAGREIERLLGGNLTKGPIAWGRRHASANLGFWRSGATKGRPRMIRIQREENSVLLKGLNGRAFFPLDYATGRINPSVVALKRVSGIYFQALDGFFYLLAYKFPAYEWPERPETPRPKRDQGPPSWAAV